ncbi:hypothetical protein [Bdellovibrio sp. HCB209]|uniref:hypothetical protein n=1 Tax=Bdellovibrio sp. HCB209 TaxID=3394354 RepID=UPI0039B4A4A9
MFTKNRIQKAIIAVLMVAGSQAFAEGGQVFFHYGKSSLANDRGGQVFTDAGGATTRNDDKDGWNVGAGLNLPLLPKLGPGDLLGEIMVDYSHFSKKKVTQASSVLLGAATTKEVTVSGLTVLVAPKYKVSFMDGKLNPWIIPVGLAFLVNSPPSDNTSYLDVGAQVGVGVEYAVLKELSIGLAYRNTFSAHEIDTDTSYSTADLYVGVNF